jgi:hypothetical protein
LIVNFKIKIPNLEKLENSKKETIKNILNSAL